MLVLAMVQAKGLKKRRSRAPQPPGLTQGG
jgi:hypothetical protein